MVIKFQIYHKEPYLKQTELENHEIKVAKSHGMAVILTTTSNCQILT
jgi:hypothetical protein